MADTTRNLVTQRTIAKALDQHQLWRDICGRGVKCIVTVESRRERRALGGVECPMVFCNVCGVGREEVR